MASARLAVVAACMAIVLAGHSADANLGTDHDELASLEGQDGDGQGGLGAMAMSCMVGSGEAATCGREQSGGMRLFSFFADGSPHTLPCCCRECRLRAAEAGAHGEEHTIKTGECLTSVVGLPAPAPPSFSLVLLLRSAFPGH